MENKKFNLAEILKGCEGITIYCSVTGENVKYMGVKNNLLSIQDKDHNLWAYPIYGNRFADYPNGECTLFPSFEQRDWSKFVKPTNIIKVNAPMMCCDNIEPFDFKLRYYDKFQKSDNKHYCFAKYDSISIAYNIIIPYDKFNPKDIQKCLKYNIQNK